MENHHLRMFITIKIVSHVVRPPRLFLWIPTDPKTSSKANFEFQRYYKIFFEHFKSSRHVFKSKMWDFLHENCFWNSKICSLENVKAGFEVREKILKWLSNSNFFVEHFFRSLGIRRIKRGGRTMRQSISMATSVRRWRFFRFGKSSKPFSTSFEVKMLILWKFSKSCFAQNCHFRTLNASRDHYVCL